MVFAILINSVSRFMLEIIFDFGATNINCVSGNFFFSEIKTEIQLSNIPKLGEQIKSMVFLSASMLTFISIGLYFSVCFFKLKISFFLNDLHTI
jgi:hypothetical protein